MTMRLGRTLALGCVACALLGAPSRARTVGTGGASMPLAPGRSETARLERAAPGSAEDTIPKNVIDEMEVHRSDPPPELSAPWRVDSATDLAQPDSAARVLRAPKYAILGRSPDRNPIARRREARLWISPASGKCQRLHGSDAQAWRARDRD
jgi:hypothetical protein